MIDGGALSGGGRSVRRGPRGGAHRCRARLPNRDTRPLEQDVASEAFDLTTALIDVDCRHTDDELWALIITFGSRLPGQLALARPDDVRRSSLLVGKASWLDQPSTMFTLLLDADRRNGTSHRRTYYDRAMHVAFTVASLDANPSTAELRAIDDWRGRLLEAMRDLLRPLTRRWPGRPARRPGQSRWRRPPVSPPPPTSRRGPSRTCWPSSTRLVGLDGVKARGAAGRPTCCGCRSCARNGDLPVTEQSRHLVFTGNPGTGKTTVARLLAQIYRTLGVVERGPPRRDRPVRSGGRATSARRRSRCDAAFDGADEGVLLIDEAYALARGGETDFGREAIDTIVKLIEDRRDSVVVIAAGYPDEMADVHRRQPRPAVAVPEDHRLPRLLRRRARGRSSSSLGDKGAYRCDAGRRRPGAGLVRRRSPATRASATAAWPATCSRPRSPARPAGSSADRSHRRPADDAHRGRHPRAGGTPA